ncbi:MAG: hypothetical protein Kow0089_12720 [Desulfobulbaceae bacterium]
MKTDRYIRKIILLAVAVLFLLPVQQARASGWNVILTLKRDTIEDAMLMPSALFVDGQAGRYYVVDSGKNRLLSFDRNGELLHVFKAGDALETPFDMARTDDGGLWIIEKGKNSLTRIDLKRKTTIPKTLDEKGRLIVPHRLETDGSLLFVLDKVQGDIHIYDTSLGNKGKISCESCVQGFFDFKVHGDTVWALDRLGKTVYRYAFSGTQKEKISLGNAVTYPVSLAIGPSGYIYVLDRHRRDIAVFDPRGAFKYRFLQPGIASGQLYYPVEVRFDPWEGLCVVDEGNARVEVYKR